MIITNNHFNIIETSPPVYLSIIEKILSGKYFARNALKSGSPIFDLMNAKILSNISIIAIEKTNDEKFLAYITIPTTIIIKRIKSIYI